MWLGLGFGITCQSQSRMFSFDMVKKIGVVPILNPHLHKICIKKEVLPKFLPCQFREGKEKRSSYRVV